MIDRLHKYLSTDDNRCKYCNNSAMDAGELWCYKGHSRTMDCDGKDFELDSNIIAAVSGKTEQVCAIDKTDCCGYKGGKCVSIENCYGKEERLVSGKERA